LRPPGSTLFLPVCDVSVSLISLIAQFVDPALHRYAPARGGANIVDDRHGGRPAGTERWLKSGFLDAARILPLSIVERQACYYVFSEPAAICQNVFLATDALGLGGWKHCGFLSLEILESMGFRTIAPYGAASFGNPVGLDGVFEASCPPYHASMDAAVDAVLAQPRPLSLIRCGGPSAVRTRTAAKRALSLPFVPVRQLTVCHLASASMSSAGTDRISGIDRRRGRPRLATGQMRRTSTGYTFR
jgi:hypothetical protein